MVNNDHTSAAAGRGGIKASKGGFAKKWWKNGGWMCSNPSASAPVSRWTRLREEGAGGRPLHRDRADMGIRQGRGQTVYDHYPTCPYSAAQWDEIRRNRGTSVVAARLLAGEMPEEMEELCAKESFLFPKRQGDMVTECSCPDWSNPCKHIAAVFRDGGGVDGDPCCSGCAEWIGTSYLPHRPGASEEEHEEEIEAEPLPAEPSRFWGPEGEIPEIRIPASLPKVHGALPGRLGPLPFWRGKETFPETMAALYESATCRAEEIYRTLEENGGIR